MAYFEIIEDESLSTYRGLRYIMVDRDTKEVLDNAQGYGYKSAQKVCAALKYKMKTMEELSETEKEV